MQTCLKYNKCGNKSISLSFMTLSAKGSWVSVVIGDPSNLFPNRKVQEQQPFESQQHQDQVGNNAKAEEDLRKVEEQEVVAANIPEVTISAVEERWTTFEEEKLATEQMLRRFGAQAVLNKLCGEVSARTNLL